MSYQSLDSQVMDGVRAECAAVLSTSSDDIPEQANLYEELGADSLQKLELMARIEQRFAIKISDEEATELDSPRAFADVVTRRLQAD